MENLPNTSPDCAFG